MKEQISQVPQQPEEKKYSFNMEYGFGFPGSLPETKEKKETPESQKLTPDQIIDQIRQIDNIQKQNLLLEAETLELLNKQRANLIEQLSKYQS